MRKDSIIRFSAVALALLTVATVVFAVINWQKESDYVKIAPTDQVWWKEQNGYLVAEGVTANGPGDKAGIKVGDRLLKIEGLPKDRNIRNVAEYQKLIYRTGVYSKLNYLLDRHGVSIELGPVIPEPADNSL
ncbi:MAG TPA: PDZ domain-containing protein, partial [Candidatus Angelobacter sp.]|nr:PDZ domain-containing protein [Candidatus Angelobacter sp.]